MNAKTKETVPRDTLNLVKTIKEKVSVETVETLTVSLYILQGQLFDLKHEVEDNTEVNENNVYQSDESKENYQSMDESSRSEEQEIEKISQRKTEFRYEYLMYWVNKGKNDNNSPKDKTNKREFSVDIDLGDGLTY